MRRRLYPEGHVSIATDLNNLAGLLLARSEPATAEPLYAEAAELYERTQGGGLLADRHRPPGTGPAARPRSAVSPPPSRSCSPRRRSSRPPRACPPAGTPKSIEALVALYEAWEKAAPGGGTAVRPPRGEPDATQRRQRRL